MIPGYDNTHSNEGNRELFNIPDIIDILRIGWLFGKVSVNKTHVCELFDLILLYYTF